MTMYKNFKLTNEERAQILEQHSSYGYRQPLNEQPTDDTIMGVRLSVIGLGPSQEVKDGTGNVIGKLYTGISGNKGYTVKIMNNSTEGIVFDPTLKGSKPFPLKQIVTDFRTRAQEYAAQVVARGNSIQTDTKYMSDDNVSKLNAGMKNQPMNETSNKPLDIKKSL